MQYRACGTYGTGLPGPAAWRLVNTSSGESMLWMSSRKAARQGAGVEAVGEVEAMVTKLRWGKRVRDKCESRDWSLEAMVVGAGGGFIGWEDCEREEWVRKRAGVDERRDDGT
nr:hypothetical protein CFP56_72075 [Quercus suber]